MVGMRSISAWQTPDGRRRSPLLLQPLFWFVHPGRCREPISPAVGRSCWKSLAPAPGVGFSKEATIAPRRFGYSMKRQCLRPLPGVMTFRRRTCALADLPCRLHLERVQLGPCPAFILVAASVEMGISSGRGNHTKNLSSLFAVLEHWHCRYRLPFGHLDLPHWAFLGRPSAGRQGPASLQGRSGKLGRAKQLAARPFRGRGGPQV